jgi:hypothetical protein
LGNGKNMGSETKGGVLEINFGNFDMVEKNTSDHCKRTVWSYPADYFLGYDNGDLLGLPSLQLVVEKEVMQAALRLDCSNHFKKSDWGHSDIFKMATEDFPVLLAPSDSLLPLEVFDRKYLLEYPSTAIWLSEAEALLPSDGLKFYTDGSGQGGFWRLTEELDLEASFALQTFDIIFQAEVYALLACSDYCLRECMTDKMICICLESRASLFVLSSHTVSTRLVLCFSARTLCRDFPFIIGFNCFEFQVNEV